MNDELDQIIHTAAVESWQKFKERIICGDTFAKELEPVIRQACEFAAQSAVELHIANEKLKANWKEGDAPCPIQKTEPRSIHRASSGEPDSSSLPVAEWTASRIDRAVRDGGYAQLAKEINAALRRQSAPTVEALWPIMVDFVRDRAIPVERRAHYSKRMKEAGLNPSSEQSPIVEAWRWVHNNGSIVWEIDGGKDGDLIASVEPMQANHLCAAFNTFWQRRVSTPKGGKA